MPRLILISFCFFVSLRSYAQQSPLLAADSLRSASEQVLDSASAEAFKSCMALKYQYDSIEHKYNSLTQAFQNQIDSLGRINLPSDKFLQKRDSVKAVKEAKLASIKDKLEILKSSTITKIEKLNLPPDLTSKANEYTGAINKLDLSIPTGDLQFPSLNLNNSLDLPALDLQNPLTGTLPNLSDEYIPGADEISEVKSQFQELNQSIPKDMPTVDQLAKTAETQVSQIKEISAVQGELSNLPSTLPTSQEQVKKELVKQAKHAVVDHFAGKEQELKSAMDQVSKLKKKFPNANNLQELNKRQSNELKAKPFVQRIVPGIAFQIQKKNDLLFVDLNPYAGYRFTSKLTAGVGWNERVSYQLDNNFFDSGSRIYGPRIYCEHKLWRGFYPRLEVETMNTFVPPYIKGSPADMGQREWVWGAFVGMKKEYKFLRKINGTALVMFRLLDPERKSPYADLVNARFGFEFPVKKKK